MSAPSRSAPKILRPHERLRVGIESRGLSVSEAARQLRCSHPALLGWIDGAPVSPHSRAKIERWTSTWPEPIRASEWPPTPSEVEAEEDIAEVHPFGTRPVPSSPGASR